MRFLIILIILFNTVICANAQNAVKYSYDSAGNRISREIILSTQPQNEQRAILHQFDDKVMNHDVKIYPNPTKGNLKIEISNITDENNVLLYVYTLSGVLILQNEITPDVNLIDLSNEPNGIYILNIIIDNEATTWRIIKE